MGYETRIDRDIEIIRRKIQNDLDLSLTYDTIKNVIKSLEKKSADHFQQYIRGVRGIFPDYIAMIIPGLWEMAMGDPQRIVEELKEVADDIRKTSGEETKALRDLIRILEQEGEQNFIEKILKSIRRFAFQKNFVQNIVKLEMVDIGIKKEHAGMIIRIIEATRKEVPDIHTRNQDP